MATPLDISVLKQFSGAFAFLFVLVMVYAILSSLPWFNDKKNVVAILAGLAAILTLFSNVAIKTINLMAPWFVLFMIFIFLVILAFMLLGVKQEEIAHAVKEGQFALGYWVFAIILIIGIASLVAVLNEETGGLQKLGAKNVTGGSAGTQGSFWETIFHPKILGLALVMLIALFTIKQMTSIE